MTLTRCRSRRVGRKRPNFKATDLPPSSLAWFVWSGLGQGLPVWFPAGLGAAAILGAELISHLAVNRKQRRATLWVVPFPFTSRSSSADRCRTSRAASFRVANHDPDRYPAQTAKSRRRMMACRRYACLVCVGHLPACGWLAPRAPASSCADVPVPRPLQTDGRLEDVCGHQDRAGLCRHFARGSEARGHP